MTFHFSMKRTLLSRGFKDVVTYDIFTATRTAVAVIINVKIEQHADVLTTALKINFFGDFLKIQ